jgi:hypothetical protein
MTSEETKACAALEAEVARAKERATAQLETELAGLASMQPTPVLLAMLRELVEMVCAAQGPRFTMLNKVKFYENVLRMLREKGIS